MKKLIYLLGALVVAGVIVQPATSQDKPFPGEKADVFLYVDVVNSPRPKANKPRPRSCTQLSAFKRGERPVWRVWGVEASTGKVLSTENVRYAYLKIPGSPNVKLNWGPHGAGTARAWFWTAGWDVPLDYPLGVLQFKVVFKTEDGKFGTFTQDGLPTENKLTILPQ